MCWILHIKIDRFFFSLSLLLLCMVLHVHSISWFELCSDVTRREQSMYENVFNFICDWSSNHFLWSVVFFPAFSSFGVLEFGFAKVKIETKNLHSLWKSMSCINMCQFIVGCCVGWFDVVAAAVAVACHFLSTWLFNVHWWCALAHISWDCYGCD